MEKKLLFFIIILFVTVNIYAENIWNIFLNDFAKSGKTLIQNPVISLTYLSGIGIATVTLVHNDLLIKECFNRNKTKFNDGLFDVFNLGGDGINVLAFNSFLYLSGVRDEKVAKEVTQAVATSSLVTYIIKNISGRQRPADTDDRYSFSPFSFKDSFPSGHATVAFAWATVISENYGIWYITYPVATMAAMARIYKNMHWASDVFMGAVIGTFCGKTICSNRNSGIYISTRFDEDAPILMVNMKY